MKLVNKYIKIAIVNIIKNLKENVIMVRIVNVEYIYILNKMKN